MSYCHTSDTIANFSFPSPSPTSPSPPLPFPSIPPLSSPHPLLPSSLKDHLSRLTAAADALAVGDVVEKSIRSKQNWGLLTLQVGGAGGGVGVTFEFTCTINCISPWLHVLSSQAVYSCVLPSVAMRGYISPQVSFPQWLGCNSKRNRLQHLLQDLQLHTHIR